MAYTEARVLKQVAVLPAQNAVNVQWSNLVLKDGVVISETYERCAYSESDKEKFLAEVEGAVSYVAILGW